MKEMIMSNTALRMIETDQTIEALNAALAAQRITADAVVAIHERSGDPLRIGRENAAKYRIIYRA
jgi:hypothetical protein